MSSPEPSEQESSPSSSSSSSEDAPPEEEENAKEEEDDSSTDDADETSHDPDDSSVDDNPSYATPKNQKTAPQDPGKPLLLSSSEDESECSSSASSIRDPYHWTDLWKRLKMCGWTVKKAPNKFDDWWYLRPGREERLRDKQQRKSMKYLEDYFKSQDEVITYCKQADGQNEDTTTKSNNNNNQKKRRTATKEQNQPSKANKKEQPKKQPKSKKSTSKSDAAAPTIDPNTDPARITRFAVDPQENTAPWAWNLPLGDFGLCREALGVHFQSGYYYQPGESGKDFSVRFQDLNELQKYYCQNQNYPIQASATPAQREQCIRWINFAHVHGRTSYDWPRTRRPSTEEACELLIQLGYEQKDNGWTNPNTNESYVSLQALRETLRGKARVEAAAASNGRRRGTTFNFVSDHELVALKLWMAESIEEEENIRQPEAVENPKQNKDKKKRKLSRQPLVPKNDDNRALENKSKKSRASQSKKPETEELVLKWDEEKDGPNPASWVVDPVPTDGWWNDCQTIGMTFSTGSYCYPNIKQRFGSTNEWFKYFCTHGGYNLDGLSEDRQLAMQRAIDSAHVQDNYAVWRTVREPSLTVIIMLLNLLGFTKATNDSWKVPANLSSRYDFLQDEYPSLRALCKAINRVPDLEDRQEEGQMRRKRAANREPLLHYKQMLAVRLFLGYNLIDKAMDIDDSKNNEPKKIDLTASPGAAEEVATHSDEALDGNISNHGSKVERLEEGASQSDAESSESVVMQVQRQELFDTIISQKEAWVYLQKLGCVWGSRYRVPDSQASFSNYEELVQHILDNTVTVLDMESRTLCRSELQKLHQYLKFFHVPQRSDAPVYEAKCEMSADTVDKLLNKLGIEGVKGGFKLPGDASDEVTSIDVIVNLIRRAKDLRDISANPNQGGRRSRHAKDPANEFNGTEEFVLRLWAAQAEYPLLFFDEESFCSENKEIDETEPAASNPTNEASATKNKTPEQMQVDQETVQTPTFNVVFSTDKPVPADHSERMQTDQTVETPMAKTVPTPCSPLNNTSAYTPMQVDHHMASALVDADEKVPADCSPTFETPDQVQGDKEPSADLTDEKLEDYQTPMDQSEVDKQVTAENQSSQEALGCVKDKNNHSRAGDVTEDSGEHRLNQSIPNVSGLGTEELQEDLALERTVENDGRVGQRDEDSGLESRNPAEDETGEKCGAWMTQEPADNEDSEEEEEVSGFERSSGASSCFVLQADAGHQFGQDFEDFVADLPLLTQPLDEDDVLEANAP